MTLRIIIFLYISFIADKYLVLLLPESLEKLPQILSAFCCGVDVTISAASLLGTSLDFAAILTEEATSPVKSFESIGGSLEVVVGEI